MQQSLNSHMFHLEAVIKDLDDRLTGGDFTSPERVRFIAELRTAQLALIHYRQAYELEQQFT